MLDDLLKIDWGETKDNRGEGGEGGKEGDSGGGIGKDFPYPSALFPFPSSLPSPLSFFSPLLSNS